MSNPVLTAALKAGLIAGFGLALAACQSAAAPQAPAAPQPPAGPAQIAQDAAWRYGFDAGPGRAFAVLEKKDGTVQTRFECLVTGKDVLVSDYVLAGPATRALMQVAIGSGAWEGGWTDTPGADGRAVVTGAIPKRHPIWGSLTPNAEIKISRGPGAVRVLPPGGSSAINDMLNTCRIQGS